VPGVFDPLAKMTANCRPTTTLPRWSGWSRLHQDGWRPDDSGMLAPPQDLPSWASQSGLMMAVTKWAGRDGSCTLAPPQLGGLSWSGRNGLRQGARMAPPRLVPSKWLAKQLRRDGHRQSDRPRMACQAPKWAPPGRSGPNGWAKRDGRRRSGRAQVAWSSNDKKK